MNDALTPGLSKTERIDIDLNRTIDFMGDDCRVYATPELVRDIEMVSRELLLEHIDGGEDSVGTRVAIDHMAATLLGMWVEIKVTVSAVEGRKVRLDVSARDVLETVAKGSHERFIVDTEVTAQRLRAKAARVG